MITKEQYHEARTVIFEEECLRFWEQELPRPNGRCTDEQIKVGISLSKKALLELTGNERGFLDDERVTK